MALAVTRADAQTVTVAVSARANIYGAGHAAPDDPGGGGAGELPVLVPIAQSGPSLLIVTAVTGLITEDGTRTWHGPEGDPYRSYYPFGNPTQILPWSGLAGIQSTNAFGFLAGVFLTNEEPQDPAPSAIDVTYWNDALDFYPQLRQVFFIGDGVGTGPNRYERPMRFRVPEGATRLYLGLADAPLGVGYPGAYSDNEGAFAVVLDVGPVTATPPTTWGAIKAGYAR